MESIEEKYAIIEKLGEGSFGRVYKAVNKQTLQVVALKQIKHPQSSDVLQEIEALHRLRHPTIVALHAVETDATAAYLVLEFMNATLLDHIQLRVSTRRAFSEDAIRHVSLQILKGLDWMHRRCGFMHRDLKPENLLVDDGVVKISDLGSATEMDSTGRFHDYVTTRFYRAPEMLMRSYGRDDIEARRAFVCDAKVDMWSVGTIMAEMYLLSPHFMGADSADQLHKICEVVGVPSFETWVGLIGGTSNACLYKIPKLRPDMGSGFRYRIPNASDSAIDLISSLCSWDPAKRPSAYEALQHPFFTQQGSMNATRSSSGYAIREERSICWFMMAVKELLKSVLLVAEDRVVVCMDCMKKFQGSRRACGYSNMHVNMLCLLCCYPSWSRIPICLVVGFLAVYLLSNVC